MSSTSHFVLCAGMMWHDAMAEGAILEKAVARMPKEMQERRERRIRRCVKLCGDAANSQQAAHGTLPCTVLSTCP